MPQPTNESARLTALHHFNILDTLTEKDYEDVTYLASVICDVPVALISFVDEDRQWFKSHRGTDISETEREYSFCSHVLASPSDIMIVEDSRKDKRFKDNPLVTGAPNIVFYAGVQLTDDEGNGLGTVCVLDTKTKKLSAEQIAALKILSKQVMRLLELRKKNEVLKELQATLESRNKHLEQFAMVVTHDIQSPLTSVILANDMLRKQYGEALTEQGNKLLGLSTNAANKIKTLVEGILHYYQTAESTAAREPIFVDDFFESLKQTIVSPQPYTINYSTNCSIIYFSKVQLEQVFYNLVNNSLRYSDKEEVAITIDLEESNDSYRFTYTDNGIGIDKADLEKIFELFTTLGSADNKGVKGSGIGLSTIKRIITNAAGTISVQSEKGKGTTFIFTIGKIDVPSK